MICLADWQHSYAYADMSTGDLGSKALYMLNFCIMHFFCKGKGRQRTIEDLFGLIFQLPKEAGGAGRGLRGSDCCPRVCGVSRGDATNGGVTYAAPRALCQETRLPV